MLLSGARQCHAWFCPIMRTCVFVGKCYANKTKSSSAAGVKHGSRSNTCMTLQTVPGNIYTVIHVYKWHACPSSYKSKKIRQHPQPLKISKNQFVGSYMAVWPDSTHGACLLCIFQYFDFGKTEIFEKNQSSLLS